MLVILGGAQIASPARAYAAASYTSASIVDEALRFVGKGGGEACKEAKGGTGDSGGQCRAFVNCVVWLASDGAQNLGKYSDYFKALAEYGDEITNVGALQRGDIVQIGSGEHTFIVIEPVKGKPNKFIVVDSNSDPKNKPEVVLKHERRDDVALGGGSGARAFRLHSTSGGKTSSDNEPSTSSTDKPSKRDKPDQRHSSTMNKDWRLWDSPYSPGKRFVFAKNNSTVSMQCWATGKEEDGTKKWFRVKVEGDSYDVGYVPANSVRNQWRSSPHC